MGMKRTYDHELLLMDPIRVMSFEPDAIRDTLLQTYELDENYLKLMDEFTEDDWRAIGDMAIDSDYLWETFHNCVEGAFLYFLEHQETKRGSACTD
jgi:hypothetical protein